MVRTRPIEYRTSLDLRVARVIARSYVQICKDAGPPRIYHGPINDGDDSWTWVNFDTSNPFACYWAALLYFGNVAHVQSMCNHLAPQDPADCLLLSFRMFAFVSGNWKLFVLFKMGPKNPHQGHTQPIVLK